MSNTIKEALAFVPPSRSKSASAFKLLRRWFAPTYRGIENIDRNRPTLFVGNHTRWAMDTLIMIHGVNARTGLYARPLADRMHYKVPVWRDIVSRMGSVLGDRKMCSELMAHGQSLLVFPGGARETSKGKGTDYELLWHERTGFVRMAIAAGYSITPFASVGPEDALDVFMDGEEIMASWAGTAIRLAGLEPLLRNGEMLFPIPRGIGPTIIPRPERFYFSFGELIETKPYAGREEEKAILRLLRDRTAASVNEMIAESMILQEKDKAELSPLRRMLQET